MTSENGEIIEPKLIAVEGKDEKNLFEELMKDLGVLNIDVKDIAGKTLLADRLAALKITPGFYHIKSLGIVRDADNDAAAAFQSVCAVLRNSQLPVPARPLEFAPGTPRVSVLVLPDCASSGMLEDICLKSVECESAMDCVNEYFDCLGQKGIVPNNLSKAKVQVFLASKPRTGIRLGIAALERYWPFQNNAFEILKDFIRSL